MHVCVSQPPFPPLCIHTHTHVSPTSPDPFKTSPRPWPLTGDYFSAYFLLGTFSHVATRVSSFSTFTLREELTLLPVCQRLRLNPLMSLTAFPLLASGPFGVRACFPLSCLASIRVFYDTILRYRSHYCPSFINRTLLIFCWSDYTFSMRRPPRRSILSDGTSR